MEEYTEIIKKAYKARGLKVNVIDVEAVLDYTSIYEPHVVSIFMLCATPI